MRGFSIGKRTGGCDGKPAAGSRRLHLLVWLIGLAPAIAYATPASARVSAMATITADICAGRKAESCTAPGHVELDRKSVV